MSSDESTEDASSQDVSTKDLSTEDVSTENVSTKDVSAEDVSTEDVSTEDSSTENVSTEDVKSQDGSTDDLSVENSSSEDVRTQDVGTEESRERPRKREYSDYRERRSSRPAPRPEANTFDVSASLDAPRRKHGTRVAFTFQCAGCEKEATLDYKPKGIPVDELLCEECMSSQENAGRWKLIRSKKAMEDQKKTFELVCSECENIEYSRHPPKRDREHLCERCLMEQAQPDKSRLEGAARVEGGVMMRKKKKSSGGSDD